MPLPGFLLFSFPYLVFLRSITPWLEFISEIKVTSISLSLPLSKSDLKVKTAADAMCTLRLFISSILPSNEAQIREALAPRSAVFRRLRHRPRHLILLTIRKLGWWAVGHDE